MASLSTLANLPSQANTAVGVCPNKIDSVPGSGAVAWHLFLAAKPAFDRSGTAPRAFVRTNPTR